MAKYENIKEILYKFYLKNKHLSRNEIFTKFIDLGPSERSLKCWLTTLIQKKTLQRIKGNDRVA